MSIATEISRLQADKAKIKEKLIGLGLATSYDNLTTLAQVIYDIVQQDAVSITLKQGHSYTIPAGYHSGGGTIVAVANEATDAEKYALQEKLGIIPKKQQQSITADPEFWGLSKVIVEPIPDRFQDVSGVKVTKDQVLTGAVFVTSTGEQLAGEMPNNGTVSQTLHGTLVSYTIPMGYHSGSGIVKIVLDTKTVTPTKEVQDIVPDEGKVLSKVTVAPIPEKYIDTTEAESPAVAENILDGKIAYVNGVKVTGTMENLGSATMSIDGLTRTQIEVGAGYTSGGIISLTDDIENQLAEI